MKVNSTGDAYLIEAVCTSTHDVEADPSTLELGDSTNGAENDAEALSFRGEPNAGKHRTRRPPGPG